MAVDLEKLKITSFRNAFFTKHFWNTFLDKLEVLINSIIIAAGGVTSINTQVGDVVLTKTDIGLGNVPNVNPLAVISHQLFVDENGSDDTGDGTLYNPYQTIQKAIDVSNFDDTIMIGNLEEDLVTIDGKSLTFVSTGLRTKIKQLVLTGGANANYFYNILFDNSENLTESNTIEIGAGGASFFNSFVFPSDVAGSNAVFIDGGTAVFYDSNIDVGQDALNTLSVEVINGGTIAAFGSILDTVDTEIGSTFLIGGGTFWNREESVFNGTLSKFNSIQDLITITNDDIEITDFNKGIILTSPDSTRWRITIDNSGVLTTTAI